MIKNDYHHGNLKAKLLETAFDFIANNDADKLTLKVLSDATGTSRSAIYRHFSSKDDLIETIIKKGYEQFDDTVAPILKDKNRSLIDRFYLSGKYYIEFAIDNPNLYRLLLGKQYTHIREDIMSIKDEDCSGFAALKSAIEEGQKNGVLQKSDSYTQSIIIWSSLHGLSSLIIDGFLDIQQIHKKLYDELFENLLAGIITNKGELPNR